MTGQTGITVTALSAAPSPAVKPITSSPGSSATSTSSTTVIQNVAGQNIIKQVRERGRDKNWAPRPSCFLFVVTDVIHRCEKIVKTVARRNAV